MSAPNTHGWTDPYNPDGYDLDSYIFGGNDDDDFDIDVDLDGIEEVLQASGEAGPSDQPTTESCEETLYMAPPPVPFDQTLPLEEQPDYVAQETSASHMQAADEQPPVVTQQAPVQQVPIKTQGNQKRNEIIVETLKRLHYKGIVKLDFFQNSEAVFRVEFLRHAEAIQTLNDAVEDAATQKPVGNTSMAKNVQAYFMNIGVVPQLEPGKKNRNWNKAKVLQWVPK